MNQQILFTASRKALFMMVMASAPAINAAAANEVTPSATILQQVGKLQGTVVDGNGDPIIGATVKVKGAKGGTITDLDGRFSLDASKGATLEVSYIGYKNISLKATTSNLQITMEEDAQQISDVVVVGYGTMRKKDLTGSVVQIRPDKLANENPGSVQDLLRSTAGVNIGLDTSAKGGGSMQIRGQRSLYTSGGHNDPLLIVDGMMFYGEMSEINPDDIAQIDILKDASAAAVYGAKAANGVIIITTKKGSIGKPTIKMTANFGFNTKATREKMRSADSYVQMYTDYYKEKTYGFDENGNYVAYAAKNTKGNLIAQTGYYDTPEVAQRLYGVDAETWKYGATDDNWKAILGARLGFQETVLQNYIDGKTYDWFDNAYRTGFNQDYNVSVSGASEKMNYYLSVGYVNNQSAYRDDNYSAVRANIKISGKVNNWLEIGANVNFQDRREDNVTGVGDDISNSPFSNHTNADGSYTQYPHGETVKQGSNWDFWRQYRDKENGVTVLNTIFNAKVKLPFNVTYQFNIAPRYSWYYNRYFSSASEPGVSAKDRGVDRNWNKHFNYSLNNTITWDQTFAKKHHVVLTLVQEAEELRYWSDNIAARNILPSDALGFHNTQNGAKENSSYSTSDTHQTADALMARLFYSYDDRYMITASVRRDGYSAFGSSNPRATFPSVAVAWNFANEKFWKWNDIMSTGKLRLSWGKNGNRSLSDPYISLSNLGSGTGSYTQYLASDGSVYSMKYLGVDRMANPNLRWEKTVSNNFGLDFGFLQDRITGSFDYYIMHTEDMIMSQPLPGFSGFSSIATNLGRVDNTGFEFSITSQNIQTKDFSWTTSAGLSYNKNRIKHLFYDMEDVKDAQGNVIGQKEKDYTSSGWFIDKPIGVIWDYKVEGIWQVDEAEEAAKYGQRPGDPKVWNNPDNDEYNEDGTVKTYVYNDDDKVFQGNRNAPWRWNLRNEFTYKNFTFSFNFYSIMGFKRSSTAYLNNYNNSSALLHNFNNAQREYWTPENPSNKYARIDAKGPNGKFSPNKWYNSSFVRLENITIGYTLPKQWLGKLGVDNLRVFGNVRNVCHFGGDWEYGDPQTGSFANRIFSLGVSATL